MSYSFSFRDRDRPRLSDRLRGKSGDELFNELRKELDQDRKSFFKNPSATPASNFGSSTGSTFPRVSYLVVKSVPSFSIMHGLLLAI